MRAVPTMLLLATAGIAAWLWLRSDAMPSSPPPERAHGVTIAAPIATDHAEPAREPGATPDAAAAPPAIPADAVWIEVQVIDQVDGTPVAGADVWWQDETTEARIDAMPPEQSKIFRADGELATRTFSWHTRADERGIARVHAHTLGTTVCAGADDRYGERLVDKRDANSRAWLAIGRDIGLVVRVVDAQGRRAVGVPVGKDCEDCTMVGGESTNADGEVHFRQIQADLSCNERGVLVSQRLHVSVRIAGLEQCAADVDALPPPKEPVTLTLPAIGELHVHVSHSGRPVEHVHASFWVGAIDDWDARNNAWARLRDPDGIVRFPFVPLGHTFTVQVRIGGLELHQTLVGPVRPGQIVHATFQVPDDAIALTGRLLSADGQPLADLRSSTDLDVDIRTARQGGDQEITTDAHGRFVLHLRQPLEPSEKLTLDEFVVSLRRGPLDVVRGEAPRRELRPGINDVGDIRLDHLPLVVSGRTHFDRAPHYGRAPFLLERWIDRGATYAGRWQVEDHLAKAEDDEGRFVVRGVTWPGRLRLNFGPFGAVEFVRGTSDLSVELTRGHTLRIRCALPTTTNGASLEYACTRDGDGPASFQPFTPSWTDAPTACCEGLPAGSYSVRIRRAEGEVVANESAIVLPTPEGLSERTIEFDLRNRLASLSLRLKDKDGGEADPWVYAFVDQNMERGLRVAHRAFDGLAIVVPTRPVDVTVLAPGCRPLLLRGVSGTVDVAMERCPKLRIAAHGIPALARNQGIEVTITGSEPPVEPRRVTVIDYGVCDLRDLLGCTSSTVWFERDETAEILVATFPRTVTATLRTNSGSMPLRLSPTIIPPGNAPLTIHFDTDEILRLLAKKPPK